VTFSLGTIAAGGSATLSVTAQAIEDGSTSDTASVTSTSPDPNTSNNSAGATTSFSEASIVVSHAITTRSQTLTNFQVATFTHANAVELANAFQATINWGDGTTSAGVITLSGTTYSVTGTHTYSGKSRHTISTTVTEVGNAVDKIGDDSPNGKAWKKQDVAHLPHPLVKVGGRVETSPPSVIGATPAPGAGTQPSPQRAAVNQLGAPPANATDVILGVTGGGLVPTALGKKRSQVASDELAESLFAAQGI
jgi:hypothetical protein